MKIRPVVLGAVLAFAHVAAQETARPDAGSNAVDAIKGGDPHLVGAVRAVEERITGIVQAVHAPGLLALRADEPARAAEARVRAERWLPPGVAEARGRAWRDLGLGTGPEPRDLAVAVAADLPGMTFDASRQRLLVDPERLPDDVVRGDPDENSDASVMLATGVAPDEPVAGHYIAHALLDGAEAVGPLTTDALLARAALAEGGANLAAMVLLFGGVGLESEVLSGALRPEDALGGRLVPGAMHSASPVVGHLLEFVYLDGFAQVAALARKGGFRRLAQERAGRKTTSDVLHVDRAPVAAAVLPDPSLPGTLGLAIADRDSLGEQGIITLVSLATGKDNLALIAGDGWAGDRLWRFEPAPGGKAPEENGETIWVSQWKTEGDAADFVYAMERCLLARFPGDSIVDDPQRGGRVLKRFDRVYRLEKEGAQVVVRVATPGIDATIDSPAKKKGPARPSNPSKK
jgi:hypothetical protein